MAYTPIEWDENTPITPANLDNMESGIKQNESDITTNEGDISDLLNFQSDVQWNSGRYTGNGDNDRQINVGFEPDFVMIVNSGEDDYWGLAQADQEESTVALFSKDHGVQQDFNNRVWSETNSSGFTVSGRRTNSDGNWHQWVAVKLG